MQSCRETLVCDNIRLVYYVFGKFSQTEVASLHRDDIISSGILGLVKAANTFDAERGTKFSTYAALCIRNEMLMYMRKARRYFGKEISLEEPVSTDETGTILTIADTIEAYENPQDECLAGLMYEEFIQKLTPLDQRVLVMRIEGYKQKEISVRLGYSQGYIARRIKGIRAKARLWILNSLARERTQWNTRNSLPKR